MAADYRAEYRRWADSPALTAAERQELEAIRENEEEIKNRFCSPLEFGTAGLRGVMGTGISRMNIRVIRQATFALGTLIEREGEEAKRRGCVVCYDCRHNSREFAIAATEILAVMGIHVRLFEDMRPTPELSFAVRYYGAVAGINITASHNPKEYNGYKVYWADGAQLPPAHAAQVAEIMAKTDVLSDFAAKPLKKALADGTAEFIGAETDDAFLEKVISQCPQPEVIAQIADELNIVYTPFHGAGRVLVPEVLKRLGVKKLSCVEEQMLPDGDFSTVKSPNPEDPEGFALAQKLADSVGADLLIGTDPDSDRIALMVRNEKGAFCQISGNQMGVLLIDYILQRRREAGELPENAAVIKTIVTTEMAERVANANGATCFNTFTGFKYMAELIKKFEADGSFSVLFCYEESFGCLIGDFVRDKDAVTAAAVMTELAAYYRLRGMSLLNAMDSLYEKYGFYSEKTLSIVMPGVDGTQRRKMLMKALRNNPPAEFAGEKVVRIHDYLYGTETDLESGNVSALELSGSDVLIFLLNSGSKVAVRPSGTEPKIKIYVMAKGENRSNCEQTAENLAVAAHSLLEAALC